MDRELAVRDQNNGGALVAAETEKAMQEVQAALVVARRFPRDEDAALSKILRACSRKRMAEEAQYAFPRGGSMVEGPSIRLAEVMAQNWGNLDFGIRELSQRDGVSEVEAYCWDMETNVRQRKVFQVKHVRYSKAKGNVELTDPRDIYEMTANQGARRLRACILGVIPKDIQEAATDQCDKTLAGASDEPIGDRIRKMRLAFEKIGVTKEMMERRLGHKLDVTTEQELVELRKIYKSIDDNMAGREQFFDMPVGATNTSQSSEALKDRLTEGIGEKSDPDGSDGPDRAFDSQMADAIDNVARNKLTADDNAAIGAYLDGNLPDAAAKQLYERLMKIQKKG